MERELEFESFMEMVVPVEEIKGRKGRKRNLFYLSLCAPAMLKGELDITSSNSGIESGSGVKTLDPAS